MSQTRRLTILMAALLMFGALKWPIERQLAADQAKATFRTGTLNLSMRQQIGQQSFLAALSGFRSLVANFLWYQANEAWARTEWGRVANYVNIVTTLQPRDIRFWDEGAWQMGWNAASATLQDRKLREAQKQYTFRKYLEQAEAILKRGIANNPERWQLYFTLGNLYRDRFVDHCRAAEAYADAAQRKGAPGYMTRFVGYELAKCPGKEQEAYEHLKSLYLKGEQEHLPALLSSLEALQEKLNIPKEQRVYNPR